MDNSSASRLTSSLGDNATSYDDSTIMASPGANVTSYVDSSILDSSRGVDATCYDVFLSFREVEASTRWTCDNVNRWKTALTKVVDLTGFILSGSAKLALSKQEEIYKIAEMSKSTLVDKTVEFTSTIFEETIKPGTTSEISDAITEEESESYNLATTGMSRAFVSGETTKSASIRHKEKLKLAVTDEDIKQWSHFLHEIQNDSQTSSDQA
ncbi:hypothetical protein L6452_26695 [Arctium lappa]|uniref:Uncharacterized protein n=1 Tax=Arctium lappa TaxID=4217 RepID=A0ACB8ZU71_ARCLA|nr:hypothetical protein L6452_26695 [Arctium lappa]